MAMPNRTDGVLISRLYIFYIFSSKMSKGHSLKGLSLLTGLPTEDSTGPTGCPLHLLCVHHQHSVHQDHLDL